MLVCASEFRRPDRERSGRGQYEISLYQEDGSGLFLRANLQAQRLEIVRQRRRDDAQEQVVIDFPPNRLDLALAECAARILANKGLTVVLDACPHTDAVHAVGCRLWSGYDPTGPKGDD